MRVGELLQELESGRTGSVPYQLNHWVSYLGQCWRSLPWWCGCRRAGGLTNSATTQAQSWGFEWAQPIYELLGCVKIQSCRISMTQGSNRTSEKRPGEDPELTEFMAHCSEHSKVKMLGQKPLLDMLVHCRFHSESLQYYHHYYY